MTTATPGVRPASPCFSSGPCAERPGWTPTALNDAALGRSHRAKVGKAKLKLAIDLTREVLGVPADYRIGITPAPTLAPSRWRSGRFSGRVGSMFSPGRALAKAG